MKRKHWSVPVMIWTGVPAALLIVIAVATVFSPETQFRNGGMVMAVSIAIVFTAALLSYSVNVYGGKSRIRPSKRKVRATYFVGGPILLVMTWLLFSVALVRGGGAVWNEVFANESKRIILDMAVLYHTGGRTACRKQLDSDNFRFSLVTDFCIDDNRAFQHINSIATVEIEYSQTSLGILVKRWKLISGS